MMKTRNPTSWVVATLILLFTVFAEAATLSRDELAYDDAIQKQDCGQGDEDYFAPLASCVLEKRTDGTGISAAIEPVDDDEDQQVLLCATWRGRVSSQSDQLDGAAAAAAASGGGAPTTAIVPDLDAATEDDAYLIIRRAGVDIGDPVRFGRFASTDASGEAEPATVRKTLGNARIGDELVFGLSIALALRVPEGGTASAQASGAISLELGPCAAVADVDGNGVADALTDGLLIIRWLFEFTGDGLIGGAVASNCTRCSAPEIAAYLDQIEAALDIDGNGITDALTDGLLMIRYLFGFRGDALINEAVGSGCTRCDAAAISAYSASLVP